MKIAKNTVISLNYQLFNENHTLIDRNGEPLVYLHGGYDNILQPVEEALEGHETGDVVKIALTAEQAFGPVDDELIREEDIDLFPPDIEVGMVFETHDPVTREPFQFRITQIDAGKVTLDGNHPLAGMSLTYEAEVAGVRAATEEEIEHGHVHGHGHGHDHDHDHDH